VSGYAAASASGRSRVRGKDCVRLRRLPRTLRERPDLDQLRRQAKELLRAFQEGDSVAVLDVYTHYHGADRRTFARTTFALC
jgi:hypothetical protein